MECKVFVESLAFTLTIISLICCCGTWLLWKYRDKAFIFEIGPYGSGFLLGLYAGSWMCSMIILVVVKDVIKSF